MAEIRKESRNGVWKALAAASLTANITLLGSYFAYGRDAISRAEVQSAMEYAIRTAPYPWDNDRGVVMGHITNPEIHETDGQKRRRIRDELQVMSDPLRQAIDQIQRDLNRLTRALEASGDICDE